MFARPAERHGALSRRQKAAAAVLAAITFGLGAVVAMEVLAPSLVAEFPDPPAAHAAPAAAPPADEAAPPSLSAYRAVIERPLFALNRRPFAPPAAAVAVGDVQSFVLAGITLSGAERTALVRHGAPPTIARLAEGEEIDGWIVREIADDRVVLRNAATDYTLRLYNYAKP